jgi:hypothetical protein
VVEFFQAGRSAYILILGIILIILGAVVMVASLGSQEALLAAPGWDRYVAASGTNQFVSSSFLISAGCIVLSINYLPRLEGEA